FVAAYTRLVDHWLVELFVAAFAEGRNVALVATGGHGRRELSPNSDLDLLLLHDGSLDEDVAQRFWYPMWDAKLKVGHATRTIADTLELAATDLATATSLLTVRLVAGSAPLADQLRERSLRSWHRRRRQVLAELSASVEQRHRSTR